ncbi:hypothetical protein [Providencia hangzhouensis]|uniref:hypothetical protein n=1 Tax=Providencia hangzhouensis TaxID=3031799 RepID=UPI003F68FA5D
MKSVVNVKINHQPVAIADCQLVLELNTAGRGFVTILTTENCLGQLIELDFGYNDSVYRYFTGFVERATPAENGAQRLFIRECTAIFERAFPCSLQHPTLQHVIDALSEQSGLNFALPHADYVNTPIPYFQHAGSGFQCLNTLGRAFSIPNYTWYQYPDGTIYVGSHADTRYAQTQIDIPNDFSSRFEAGNTQYFPLIPAIRPGMVVNGQCVTKISVNNDEMALTWTPRDKNGNPAQKPIEQRQIERLFPELASKLHVPRLAKVISPADIAVLGDVSDPFRPRFAVNVQLLDENGQPAADTPEYAAVPLPVTMASHEGGFFQYPPEGAIVEIGFADGRPDKPVIRQTLQEGLSLPDIKPGEQLQQQRAGVSQRVTTDGSWQRETDQTIQETSASRIVTSDREKRTTTQRTTTVNGNDDHTVIGTHTLLSGAIVQVADGDYCIATNANVITKIAQNRTDDIGQNHTTTVGQNQETTIGGVLNEKISGIRKSLAATHEMIGGSFHLGNAETNLLTLMTDMLDTIDTLAKLTAEHTHSNTGTPTNASAIQGVSSTTKSLNKKYHPLIS